MTITPVALVTGGTRGIGLGIAAALAREGFELAVCGVRDEAAAQDSLDQLRAGGGKVLYCQCDVGSRPARAAMIAAVQEKFGQLNLLVNNAGVAPRERVDMLAATEEEFDRVLQTNLKGPYFLTQLVANWMVQQRQASETYHGCIVNVSSISATLASVARGEYCISKAGISMATQLWAVRLAEFEIPVFEVRPGIIATDMTAAVQEKYDQLIAEGLIPQGRWGQPEDTGRAIAALARGDFAYSTGQVIMVDGGLTLGRLG